MMSGLLNFVRGGVDHDAVLKDDKKKRAAERAEADAAKAAELAEREAPAKEVAAVMATDADAADEASHADYLTAVEYVADKRTGPEKPSIIRKGVAWMRRAKISPQGFAFDVRQMLNKRLYDRTLANYDSDLKSLIKERDAAKVKLTKAENDLKAAKEKFTSADQAARELESTQSAYNIFRRRHVRLFGSTAENLDINARNQAYSVNGWAV